MQILSLPHNKNLIKKYRTLIVHLSAVFCLLYLAISTLFQCYTHIFVYPVWLILCLILLLMAIFLAFRLNLFLKGLIIGMLSDE